MEATLAKGDEEAGAQPQEQIDVILDDAADPVAEQANLVAAVNEVAETKPDNAAAEVLDVMTRPALELKPDMPDEAERNTIKLEVMKLNLSARGELRFLKDVTGKVSYAALDADGWSQLAAKTTAIHQKTEK